MIVTIAAVAVGGALGTLARFFTGNWITANWPQHFYGATLLVNLVGCLLIGVLYGLFLVRPEVPLPVRAGLIVGVLGGFTTFSSFSWTPCACWKAARRRWPLATWRSVSWAACLQPGQAFR